LVHGACAKWVGAYFAADDDDVDLIFRVFDDENIEDKQSKSGFKNDDDYCGMAVVSLTEVIKNDAQQTEGDEKEWLPLDIGKGKMMGQLCVSMRYKEGALALMHA
jgi:hypothetical protein